MSKLSDYLLCKSYTLSPDEIEEIVEAALAEAGAEPTNKQLVRLRVARVVSGVGHIKGALVS